MSGGTQKEADPPSSSASSVPQSPPREIQSLDGTASDAVGERIGPALHTVAFRHIFLAAVIVSVSGILVAIHFQSFLEDSKFRGALVSAGMHKQLRGIVFQAGPDAAGSVDVPLMPIMGLSVAAALSIWFLGSSILALVSWSPWRLRLWQWGLQFLWLWLLGLFEAFWDATGTLASSRLEAYFLFLSASLPVVQACAWGGWIAGAVGLTIRPDSSARIRRLLEGSWVVWAAAAIYTLVFSTLIVLQYSALMVPHGDSAMYEEHLWNLLHGKGFRSQLDSGRLFFGEHFEIVHLFLLPVYIPLPHFLTLNICLTLGLASGAIAVRGITKLVTGSSGASNWLAATYLLYFPLQYLNMEVSLKTLRPENFGVPLLLFAIWALEAKRFRTLLVLLGLTLTCKEDYAIPVAMIGLFLLFQRESLGVNRSTRWIGLGIFVVSSLFLGFVLTVFIPAFRAGPPHYMAYYPELGNTPVELVNNLLRSPGRLLDPLVGKRALPSNLSFIISLLAPLALLPAAGISRLWLCLPTLVSVLLIQLPDARSPYFHFHAPLLPILFWAAADGLARLDWLWARWGKSRSDEEIAGVPKQLRAATVGVARVAAGCALVTGFVFGKSPLSLPFYDPGAGLRGYWKVLYCQNGMITFHARNLQQMFPTMSQQDVERFRNIGRERSFNRLFALIPRDASVAATDFIRPRFTHHRQCHQYGAGGLKPHVNPDQIDYIVIDLVGPYSDWFGGQHLSELSEHPDRWEVMHWDPDGELFFYVLRAKR